MSYGTYETLKLERRGPVGWLINNRPQALNAMNAAMRDEFADAWIELDRDPEVRVIVHTGEGRAFQTGVDVTELATDGMGMERYRDSVANFDLHFTSWHQRVAKPVITAVNGFCVGGGIGLAGNSDVVIASEDAFFGLPEVDRGALGAATHLARLVPQHKMRAMVYTGATATAQELHHFGSVLKVVPRDELRAAAFEIAENIAEKSPTVMRAAKESLNGIDLWDVKRSYRFEQGFTFELNLSGVSDELRDAFVEGRDADTSK